MNICGKCKFYNQTHRVNMCLIGECTLLTEKIKSYYESEPWVDVAGYRKACSMFETVKTPRCSVCKYLNGRDCKVKLPPFVKNVTNHIGYDVFDDHNCVCFEVSE